MSSYGGGEIPGECFCHVCLTFAAFRRRACGIGDDCTSLISTSSDVVSVFGILRLGFLFWTNLLLLLF